MNTSHVVVKLNGRLPIVAVGTGNVFLAQVQLVKSVIAHGSLGEKFSAYAPFAFVQKYFADTTAQPARQPQTMQQLT